MRLFSAWIAPTTCCVVPRKLLASDAIPRDVCERFERNVGNGCGYEEGRPVAVGDLDGPLAGAAVRTCCAQRLDPFRHQQGGIGDGRPTECAPERLEERID